MSARLPLRVCAVVPVLYDDPAPTIASIKQQTNVSSIIRVAVGSLDRFNQFKTRGDAEYVFVKPDFSQTSGVRTTAALNSSLCGIDLTQFDYMLRVDADVTLPQRFVEVNSKLEAALVGESQAMLFSMPTFLKVFSGRFPEGINKEDTYVVLKLITMGYHVPYWLLPPYAQRVWGAGKSRRARLAYFFKNGYDMWKLGFEPIHVIGDAFMRTVMGYDPWHFFEVLGYFTALVRREKRYDIARRVTISQLTRIFKGVRTTARFQTIWAGNREGKHA